MAYARKGRNVKRTATKEEFLSMVEDVAKKQYPNYNRKSIRRIISQLREKARREDPEILNMLQVEEG